MLQKAMSFQGTNIINSYGCMCAVGEFLEQKELVLIQRVNKRFYEYTVPRMKTKLEMPFLFLVLESGRKKISIGFWRDNMRQCGQFDILKIGNQPGEVNPSELHFSEVYFQYFIPTHDHHVFVAFELEQEAILKRGFLVEFDSKWQFKQSKPLPLLSDNTMRPTACLLGGRAGQRLLMLGGRQDRSSQMYSFAKDKWQLSPKLPLGHNITTNITVNWQDKVVFTFIIDAQLTIKSACLDLERSTWTEQQTENTEEMYWAMDWQQSEHKIDRLHLKSALVLSNKNIAVVARGRPENCLVQITGLILHFKVIKTESGKYALETAGTQRIFPSIFCRQLDFAQRVRNKLVITQDTADDEKYEAFSIDITPGVTRSDGECQKHFRHIFTNQK